MPGRADRLHSATGPAVVYPDGWAVHAWHGTRVPSWVIDDPTVDRITAEPNVEVRRCAIERIGWPAFIDAGRAAAASSRAADPGNPGCELRLYDLPRQKWDAPTRLLLAVNGSVERDGTRRRYGLRVPAGFDHPLDAAGWSYGLTGAQYARPAAPDLTLPEVITCILPNCSTGPDSTSSTTSTARSPSR